MNEDPGCITRKELIVEIKSCAQQFVHRDSSKHALCWHHPQLWDLLPEKTDPEIVVPAWPQLLRDVYITANRWIFSVRMRRA